MPGTAGQFPAADGQARDGVIVVAAAASMAAPEMSPNTREQKPCLPGRRPPMDQATAGSPRTSVRHALAPLTPDEAGLASRLSLAAAGPGSRLAYCALAEPAKRAVLAWDGRPLPREARCVLYQRPPGQTWVVTVSLDEAAVISKILVPGVQPPIMAEEWMANTDQIKADPGFQAALARRGITDMSMVQVDPWPASNFGLEIDASGRRLARGVAYLLDGPGSNPYARPIENLVAVADRDTGEVLEIEDGEVVPIPGDAGRYDAASVGELRPQAALHIVQPDGPGFTVDDGLLAWGPWQMRVSLHPIGGLVLHQIGYLDHGRLRPIIYRAGLSEMIVPYGSTAMNHWWKNAFDAGDVGLGKMANPLEPGCECLGEIVYLDAAAVDE
ncbi:MAG: hypothetical protein ACRDND_31300, partial [Streptosporangiaceae bacterium]